MKTSIALSLAPGLYCATAQPMCYIVETGAGQTAYISERPPVNMAAESPSKEVQSKYPGGHMLIVPKCPLTSNEQEARRLQAISTSITDRVLVITGEGLDEQAGSLLLIPDAGYRNSHAGISIPSFKRSYHD